MSLKSIATTSEWISQAEKALNDGNRHKADYCYQKALECEPNNVDLLFKRLWIGLGNRADIVKRLDEIDPNNPGLLVPRILLLDDDSPNYHETRLTLIEDVLARNPHFPDALLLKFDHIPNDDQYEYWEFIKQHLPDDPLKLLEYASRLQEPHDLFMICVRASSKDFVELAIEKKPENFTFWNQLYKDWFISQPEISEDYIENALRIEPNNKEANTHKYLNIKRLGRHTGSHSIARNLLTFRSHVRLLDFFRTGQLGTIQIGSTRQEVEKEFGRPESFRPGYGYISDMRDEKRFCRLGYQSFEKWHYGVVELSFGATTGRVWSILIYLEKRLWTNSMNLDIDWWVFENEPPITVDSLELSLETEGIAYTMSNSTGDFGVLFLDDNRRIVYSNNARTINSISFYDFSYKI